MARKAQKQTPADEEIMSYNNVPVSLAAEYIGWSACNIRYALQQERAPFGCAAKTREREDPEEDSYTYNISPGLLVAYKHGTIQAWRLGELVNFFEAKISSLINARLEIAAEMVRGIRLSD